MRKFGDYKNNLYLAIIFSFVTISSELMFYALSKSLINRVPVKSMVIITIAIFLFSFIRNNVLRFFAMGFVFFLNFFQMIHLEIFGTSLIASELYLALSIPQILIYELKSLLINEGTFVYSPLLILILGSIILLVSFKILKPNQTSKLMPYFFIFYILFNPVRTYLTGNNWGKQPAMDEFGGMNFYLSVSYFIGKILPAKLNGTIINSKAASLNFIEKSPQSNNIIVVFGETLSHHHMSLFDYKRNTTPFLRSIKDKIFYSKALSVGVSTDIVIPFFINNTYGLNSAINIVEGKNCLFKFAKKQKYETFFHTVQVDQQMKYIINSICPKSIDHLLAFEDLFDHNDPNHANDMRLLDTLKNIDFTKKNFIMLHQRGSHSPYSKRVFQTPAKFQYNENEDRRITDYDNSVLEFDLFMKRLYEKISKMKEKIDVIYISDHGEALGQDGRWGHGKLNKYSYEVPVILFNNYDKLYQFKKPLTHISVSSYVSKLLGYELSNYDNNRFTTMGSDIDGFSGHIDFEFKDEKIHLIKVNK